jgi:hypothetical protein
LQKGVEIEMIHSLVQRIINKLWKIRPWENGYHGYTYEIVAWTGLFMMLIGTGINLFGYNLLVVAFGAGTMFGGMFNQRLQENRERGWSWRAFKRGMGIHAGQGRPA